MNYRGIFEYEYPTEHKPPVSVDVHLHGDCVKGKIIEWEYKPLEQEPRSFKWCETCKEYDQEKHCCHRWSKVIRNAVEALQQEPMLDKIRAEIVELTRCPYGTECLGANCPSNTDCMLCGDHVLEIIDKYKAESEE